MSAPQLEDLFRLALSLGIPADEVSRARQDPALLMEMATRLRAAQPPAGPAKPLTSKDALDKSIEQITAARERALEEQKRPQRHPPAADRFATIKLAERMRRDLPRMYASQAEGQFTWNFMGLPKSSSNVPLDQLKPIRLKEMLVSKTHTGRYLLCRIVSSPARMVAVTVVVEDQDGRAGVGFFHACLPAGFAGPRSRLTPCSRRSENLSIYKLALHGVETGPDLDALFPRGAVLAIREPTYKPNQNGLCHLVRIESPTDYEILSPEHPLVKGARWATPSLATPRSASIDFKAVGNRYFSDKKDLLAVKAYSDGLDATDDASKRLVLFLNRSQAHLRLGHFASALRDTSAVLGLLDSEVPGPPLAEVKATLRGARALEGMRQLTRAREAFARVLELDSTSADAQSGLQRVDKMLHQSRTGEYDWRELHKVAARQQLAVGDYVGPVKAVVIDGLEKAFATGWSTEGHAVVGFDFSCNSMSNSSQLALITALAAKVKDDPATSELLYSLHGGAKAQPIGTATLGAVQDRPVGSSAAAPFADISRIEGIYAVNSFSLNGMATPATTHALSGNDGSVLFLGGSLFNHSCLPNGLWRTYGDVQVIRARTSIRAGEEVCVAYIPADGGTKRDSLLKGHFPEGCPCNYCVDEGRDTRGDVGRRARLLGPSSSYAAIREEMQRGQPISPVRRRAHARTMKTVVDQLRSTYSHRRGSLRPDMLLPLTVAGIFTESSQPGNVEALRQATAYDLEAISAMGGEVRETPEAVKVVSASVWSPAARSPIERILLKIAWRHSARRTVAGDKDARKWIKAAAEMARILHGVDFDGFIELAQDDVDELDLVRFLPSCRG